MKSKNNCDQRFNLTPFSSNINRGYAFTGQTMGGYIFDIEISCHQVCRAGE